MDLGIDLEPQHEFAFELEQDEALPVVSWRLKRNIDLSGDKSTLLQ